MAQLDVSTKSKAELVDITSKVQKAVSESGVQSGVCHVFAPHTTAGLVLNENWDPAVSEDIVAQLGKLVSRTGSYRHTEGNAPAHIKSSIVGASQIVPVEGGKLVLGTWQGIFLAEFDGPRRRQVVVKVIPD